MISITEVGPRDGLQNEDRIVPTAVKVAFIDALSLSGLDEIEATSFVSPRWIPQLADAEDVLQRITRHPGVAYTALVPNERGLERALLARPDKIAVFLAVSETFNRKNVNTDREGAFARIAPVVRAAHAAGIAVRGYVSTVFFCPYEGRMPVSEVVKVVARLLDLGCDRVALGDTVGRATPEHTREVIEAMPPIVALDRIGMHFHDTEGRAAENVAMSAELGVRQFDGSVGGLGGCPYAGPGAPGNVATETVVRTLRKLGHEVGVDLDQLARARRVIQAALSSDDATAAAV